MLKLADGLAREPGEWARAINSAGKGTLCDGKSLDGRLILALSDGGCKCIGGGYDHPSHGRSSYPGSTNLIGSHAIEI
jgi:hypothetical protein